MDKKPVENTNVIDLFTRKPLDENESSKIIRLAPEMDGMEMLYSNDANPGKLFSMKILCWALTRDGNVDAMVPWLNRLVPARELNDPLNGHWEGYYDSFHELAYFEPPEHKVLELESSANFYNIESEDPEIILQEINDNIGTHAILSEDSFKTVVLVHVTSWRLFNDGRILAMVANEEEVDMTPILVGDECLYAAQEHENFRYFFHHIIANKIKKGDPDAISAFTKLVDE
ncbi:hypothetical protein GZ77_16160 [Endozoicomonas montiporae]|uniref:Uncharacterized protein n=2 Tax=Endozoicomonas montiporae TaxID=1027273 RepID=A0A081N5T6_9GAMM|nr:hypothetical protein [Endozoicomonas montiporae]AMO57292.1 hypothetical protein EZMO1_3293 [Endozoicomonas montiporae CL-33]KEQ13809.1 hypothetical protein GZ77_16160 [Endozoicomonas montiporae]